MREDSRDNLVNVGLGCFVFLALVHIYYIHRRLHTHTHTHTSTGYFCKNKVHWLSDVNSPELSKRVVPKTFAWRTSKPYLLCGSAGNLSVWPQCWDDVDGRIVLVVKDSSPCMGGESLIHVFLSFLGGF